MVETNRNQDGYLLKVKYSKPVYFGLLRYQRDLFSGTQSNRETLAQFIERGFVAYDHSYDLNTGERI